MPIDNFSLIVNLGAKSSGEFQFRAKHVPKCFSEVTRKFHISIRHNGLGQIMQFDNTVKEYFSNPKSITVLKQGTKWVILEKRSTTTKSE